MANQANPARIETGTAWIALGVAAIGVFPAALSAFVCLSGLQSENAEMRREWADAKATLEKRDAELERRLIEFRVRDAKESEAMREQIAKLEQKLDKSDAQQEAIRQYVMSLTPPKGEEPSNEQAAVDVHREGQVVSKQQSGVDWREILAAVFFVCAAVGIVVFCVFTPNRKHRQVIRRIHLYLKEILLRQFHPKFMNIQTRNKR